MPGREPVSPIYTGSAPTSNSLAFLEENDPDRKPQQDSDTQKPIEVSMAPDAVPNEEFSLLKALGEETISPIYHTEKPAIGHPAHALLMTNLRLIVGRTHRILGFVPLTWETSVAYRDIVHVSVGRVRHRRLLDVAVVFLLLGSLFITICQFLTAIITTAIWFAIGLGCLAIYLLGECTGQGVDLTIDVCKPYTGVGSWGSRSKQTHAFRTFCVRLSSVEAYTLMYRILKHPDVPILAIGAEGRERAGQYAAV